MLKTSIHDIDPSETSTASFEGPSLIITSAGYSVQFDFGNMTDIEDFHSWLQAEAEKYFVDNYFENGKEN